MNDIQTETVKVTTFNCGDCGILMGIPTPIRDMWENTHKKFHCPNGHQICWSGKSEQEKELETLRTEVKDLKEKLASALEEVANQKKKLEEMTLELEIWTKHPSESLEG